jgi:hypothetical protein
VLVRSHRSARLLIVLVALFSVLTGALTVRYPSTFFLLPDVLGGLFILAGLGAFGSMRCFWKSRWLAVGTGTALSGAALLRGLAIWYDVGWARAWAAVSLTADNPQDTSRVISGALWMVYGSVLMVAWPGLVHDSSIRSQPSAVVEAEHDR